MTKDATLVFANGIPVYPEFKSPWRIAKDVGLMPSSSYLGRFMPEVPLMETDGGWLAWCSEEAKEKFLKEADSNEKSYNCVPVLLYKGDEFVKRFKSSKELIDYTHLSQSSVSRSLKWGVPVKGWRVEYA